MSRTFSVHPGVRADDLPPAIDYYRKADPSLPARFLDDLDHALELIEEHPLIGHELFEVYRRRVFEHFPYLVAYRVTNDAVRVLALIHGKRDPEKIKAEIDDRAQ